MKKLFITTLYTFLAIVLLGVSPVSAQTGGITVVFETDPLYAVDGLVPGWEGTRFVDVTNNHPDTKSIYVQALNVFDPDGVGDAFFIDITDGVSTLFSNSFTGFFNAGKVFLSDIPSGETTRYFIIGSFDESTDSNFEGSTVGYSFCFGVVDGAQSCDGTDSGSSSPSPDGSSGGGSGGGGGSGSGGGGTSQVQLVIDDESITSVSESGTALVTWETNLLSTSQVIYGLASGGPYTLNLNTVPYFGYPFGTIEDSLKTTTHVVEILGLIPGETYKFRVVSRASPPSISTEYEFVFDGENAVFALNTDAGTPTLFDSGAGGEGGAGDGVAQEGGGSGTTTSPVTALEEESGNNQAAAALFGLPAGFFKFLGLFLLVIFILFLGAFWWTRRRSRSNSE